MSALPDRFPALINRFLETVVADLIRERAVPDLAAPMIYSLAAGGKRLRPVLCLLAAGADVPDAATHGTTAAADSLRSALYLGAALECIHTYSLIHDDLPAMDDDDLRRGRPACHIQFNEWAAILAGDALNTFAFELLAIGLKDSAQLGPALETLSRAAGMAGMVGGQTLDLQWEKNPSGRSANDEQRRELLREIHLKKTTALIAAALELGAILAGAERAAFRAYGESIGLLFQISDDLLDRTGTSASLGKTPGKDEAAGKLTYPALYGMDESRRIAADLAARARDQARALTPGPRTRVDHREILAALPGEILRRNS